jgi:hypothetical protein
MPMMQNAARISYTNSRVTSVLTKTVNRDITYFSELRVPSFMRYRVLPLTQSSSSRPQTTKLTY